MPISTISNANALTYSGAVLQVVSATKTDTASFTSSTFSDVTGLSVSITPKSATSKILVMVTLYGGWSAALAKIGSRLLRNSTPIFVGDASSARTGVSGSAYWNITCDSPAAMPVTYLDSPSTTSTITYKMQANSMDNTSIVYVNRGYSDLDATWTPRNASSITVMEIAG